MGCHWPGDVEQTEASLALEQKCLMTSYTSFLVRCETKWKKSFARAVYQTQQAVAPMSTKVTDNYPFQKHVLLFIKWAGAVVTQIMFVKPKCLKPQLRI
jgi:hypothetical protein